MSAKKKAAPAGAATAAQSDTTIMRENLVSMLSRCAPITKAKGTLPILACVRLDSGERLTASATDLYQSVVARAELVAPGPAWSCAVNAKDFLARASTFPDGPITLTLDDDKLHLTAGKRKHRLPTVRVDDFPAVVSELAAGWELSAPAFHTLLTHVRPAACEEVVRAAMHSVGLSTEGDTLVAAATDGHHLHVAEYPGAGRLAAPINVPLAAVDALLALLAKAESLTLGLTNDRLTVAIGDTIFSAALVADKFPPYQQMMGDVGPLSVQAPCQALGDASRSVALASADGPLGGLLTFGIDGDEMTITGEGKGAASDVVHLDGPIAEPFRFSLFLPLLLAALVPIPPSSPATLHLGPDPLSPIRVTCADLPGYVALCMPCRG